MGHTEAQDNTPPHSIEAEQQVLGSLLLRNEGFDQIIGKLSAEDFYDPVHQKIFETIEDRINSGVLASPVTLKPAFENDEALKQLGGPAYFARLAGASVATRYIKDYATILTDLSVKRRLLELTTQSSEEISEGKASGIDVGNRLETGVGALLSKNSFKPLIRSHLSSVIGAVTQINDARMGETPVGVPTGLPQLDRHIGLLRAGQMILIPGRPSMGKTTVAQNMAFHAAKSGVGVFFGSLEMLGEELAMRFLSKGLAEKGRSIPYQRMIKGELNDAEFQAVMHEAKEQEALPMQIAEREVRDVGKFRAAARRARQEMDDSACPLGLIVLDYVQKMSSEKYTRIYDVVSAASDMCKDLAMDFGVPVVALAQLSRGVEQRDPPVPQLSDIRETGKLEEDADVVMACYRDAYYLQRKMDATQDVDEKNDLHLAYLRCQHDIDMIVLKQRSGPVGTVSAFIDPACCHVYPDRSEQEGALI